MNESQVRQRLRKHFGAPPFNLSKAHVEELVNYVIYGLTDPNDLLKGVPPTKTTSNNLKQSIIDAKVLAEQRLQAIPASTKAAIAGLMSFAGGIPKPTRKRYHNKRR